MSDRNEVSDIQPVRNTIQEKFLFIYELPPALATDELPSPSDTSSLLHRGQKHEMLKRVSDNQLQVITNMQVVDYASKEKDVVECIFPRLLVLNLDKTLL